MQELRVPDIGDYRDIPVIEVLVRAGDVVEMEQPLVTLESDKATMDVPSALAGTIREVLLKPGDLVSHGSVIAHLVFDAPTTKATAPAPALVAEPAIRETVTLASMSAAPKAAPVASVELPQPAAAGSQSPARPATPAHKVSVPEIAAGPSVRKLSRELGVNLATVKGSGRNARVLREDVLAHVKDVLFRPAPAAASSETRGANLDILPWPQVDFAKFGPVERWPLSRIRKISGANLHRNWVMIPHVTNFDQADVTELEALRAALNRESKERAAAKVTMLAFLVKACVAALQRFPQFNVSLDGQEVVQKRYFHIGFAADTPNGLVVPVIRDADRKGIAAIAAEMAELATLAREGKLASAQMQGGSMSVSSLGGIGGTHFTPIINAPEVAILGVGRATTQPVWNGSAFEPRLILPLSLSWDHRAVDGAAAGRFLAYLASLMADFRRVLL